MFLRLTALAVLLLGSGAAINANDAAKDSPPSPNREFRAAWVATVANIDWPSAPGLPGGVQQQEMIEILDLAKKLNLNAIVFQVRPACDALYASELEPWSDFLTGTQGKAPEPFYDPLEFAINESHKRGLELHAWVNPYRARHPSSKSEISEQHVSKANPTMAVKYGKHIWLDPGQKAVQDYSLKVIMDIVKRYDVDGIHMDDYFYPYREKNSEGEEVDFPDEPSWMEFVGEGGLISRDDWRRENVNSLIQRTYKAIKAEKQWVKFGVSPFGIWQPGFPQQIQGFNAYEQIYCDSKKWLNEGWLDYVAPQLYWKIEAPAQSYPVLLQWWVDQNTHGRHIWVGNFTSRVNDQWEPEEIVNQVKATREQQGASGNIHFSMKPLLQNRGNLTDELAKTVYTQQALIPEMTWEKPVVPGTPSLKVRKAGSGIEVTWQAPVREKVWRWALQKRINGVWVLEVLPGAMTSISLGADENGKLPDFVAIAAVSRYGSLSPSAAQGVQ
ncbi:MAG: family 10 glycosylhydrolase [Verrucomicrobia bacterium]|nr:family 10 glycosylhydrolase [Verrucomicrobiota bacterium]